VDWDRVIRDAFSALTRFDADALATLCDEDVAIRPVRAAFEDTVYRGHEGVARFIRDSHETWTELRAEADEVETVGDRALIVGALRGRSASGLPLDAPVAWIVRAFDGKILKVTTYVDRDEARRDFRG
jgi:ketosteroid isomerase-like protein